MTPETRRRLVELGAFGLPIVLVLVAGAMFDAGGPAAVDASAYVGPDETPALPVPEAPPWTAAERAAAEHAAALAAAPFPESPMLHVAPVRRDPVAPVTVAPDPEPDLRLNGIMRQGDAAIAFVNARAWRLGETIDGEWIVAVIDVERRRAVFRHVRSGREVEKVVPGG